MIAPYQSAEEKNDPGRMETPTSTPSGATPSGATPSGATPSGATPSGAKLSGAEQLEEIYRLQQRYSMQPNRRLSNPQINPYLLVAVAATTGALMGWLVKRSPLFRRSA